MSRGSTIAAPAAMPSIDSADRPIRPIFGLTLAYILLGAGGMLLAIPSGYASPVFPAAGLALAGVLQFGNRVLLGIWLGSTVLNVGYAWVSGHLTPASLPLAGWIGLGATAQAFLGAWLVTRRQGGTWQVLEREQDAFRFLLLGGFVGGLLSPVSATLALLATGVVQPAVAPYFLWNWYVGDVLGILVFAPLALAIFNRQDPLWRERLQRTTVPVLVTLGLAILAIFGTARWETHLQETRLQSDGERIARKITDRLITHREVLASLRHFIEATPDFTFAQFEQFTRITLQDNPDIFALSFNDLVTETERSAYEERVDAHTTVAPFLITELDSERRPIPARSRSDYVVVRFIVPLAANRAAVGFDIGSEPVRRAAIERAKASGAMAVTAPILLVQEQRPRVGLLELQPVGDSGDPQGSPRPRGFAVAVVKVDDMIAIATGGQVPDGLRFHLTDRAAPNDRGLLYASDAAVAGPSPVPDLAADWTKPLHMGDRDWLLAVTASESYRQGQRPWVAWAVGAAGLLFATLLQVLLLGMTGRAAIIQRKNAQLLLAEKVFDHSGEAIVVTDAKGNMVSTNPAFTHLTGYAAAEVRGRNMRLLQSGRHTPDFYRELWQRLLTDGQWQGEIWNRRKNGELFPEWLTISALRDTAGTATQYVGIFSDISAPTPAQEHIEFLAYHDPLTRLPNRVLGMDQAERAIVHARRANHRMALLLLDLDKFKLVNDTYGHGTGDALLQAVATRLQQTVRADDTLCRISGDEFLIVLFEAGDNADVSSWCERILLELSRPFNIQQRQLNTSFSIGVAICPEDGDSVEVLMRHADTALYGAKREGRNTYRFFDVQMNLDVMRYVQTREALERALERGEFELYYQPLIALHGEGDRVVGAEALLRWNHAQRGTVSPGEFIDVAEESGLIRPIGAWVLHQACRQIAAWQRAGLPLEFVAVNLSAVQFRDDQLADLVLAALTDAALRPGCLELELTESILIADAEPILSTVRRLQSHGIQLSIDDFGTGYSSLSYLKRFNVDKIKIDRSFVRELAWNSEDRAIVRAIVEIARSLGLKTLAEGVENAEALAILRELGCDQIQGFLYSRPLPADALVEYVRAFPGRS